jgi:tripartite-type tricarboxylate transporter receptor subunit TctC
VKHLIAKVIQFSLGLALSLSTVSLHAEYPDKPIKMIIGYAPGGGADNLIRPIGEKLAKVLGTQIVMDYHPGAGGVIAAELTSKAAPDGYTLQITDSGPMTIVPNLRKVSYNPVNDFTPIAMVGSGGVIMVTQMNSPINSVSKLVEAMKDKQNTWSNGTSGIGGVGHLAGEQFKIATGVDMNHIPYKGGAPAIVELMGGHVPLLFSSLGAASAHLKAGRITALAVTSAKRSSMFPEVPTLAESGFPGFDATIWFGISGPANLPPKVSEKLTSAFAKILQDADIQEAIKKEGYEPMQFTPAQIKTQITQDLTRWSKVIVQAKVSID